MSRIWERFGGSRNLEEKRKKWTTNRKHLNFLPEGRLHLVCQHIDRQAKIISFTHPQNIMKSLKSNEIDELPIIGKTNENE